jgi:sec-independent protein translocase protein TatA
MSLGLIGSLGTTELIVILVIALLMFGGRLPDVARSIGKSVNQFKRGLKEVDDEVTRPEPPPTPRSLPREADSTRTPDSVKEPESSIKH